MRAYVFVYTIEVVAHDHAQKTPLVKNWASSCVQAAERDLLVAYPLIEICDVTRSWKVWLYEISFDLGVKNRVVINFQQNGSV